MSLWLPLSVFVSLISLFLPPSLSPFPFHVLWLGALSFSACFLYTVHSVCVLIAAILGERGNDEQDLFENCRARFCGTTQRGAVDTWSAWRARGRHTCSLSLLPPSALPSLSVRPLSLSFLSLTFAHTLSVFALLELGENSCSTACTQASPLTSPTYPINHGTLLTPACMNASVLEREKLRTLWVNNFERTYLGGLRPLFQL